LCAYHPVRALDTFRTLLEQAEFRDEAGNGSEEYTSPCVEDVQL
jgi:hypothetical protein